MARRIAASSRTASSTAKAPTPTPMAPRSPVSSKTACRRHEAGGCDATRHPPAFWCAAGVSLTLPTHAALLLLITPILISLAAVYILKEKLSIYKILGLTLGITGAVILITAKNTGGYAKDIFLGDVLIILNAIVYAVYFILVKPLMQEYNPLHVIRWVFTIGFFMLLPLGFNQVTQVDFVAFSSLEWMCILLVVVAGTFFAYFFNIYGLKTLGAGITGAYIYTQPVFAAIIANIFLGEVLDRYKILAAILIFTGVFLTTKSTTKNA